LSDAIADADAGKFEEHEPIEPGSQRSATST
jgi:hypothetical protein